jgi:hypothetical protein
MYNTRGNQNRENSFGCTIIRKSDPNAKLVLLCRCTDHPLPCGKSRIQGKWEVRPRKKSSITHYKSLARGSRSTCRVHRTSVFPLQNWQFEGNVMPCCQPVRIGFVRTTQECRNRLHSEMNFVSTYQYSALFIAGCSNIYLSELLKQFPKTRFLLISGGKTVVI